MPAPATTQPTVDIPASRTTTSTAGAGTAGEASWSDTPTTDTYDTPIPYAVTPADDTRATAGTDVTGTGLSGTDLIGSTVVDDPAATTPSTASLITGLQHLGPAYQDALARLDADLTTALRDNVADSMSDVYDRYDTYATARTNLAGHYLATAGDLAHDLAARLSGTTGLDTHHPAAHHPDAHHEAAEPTGADATGTSADVVDPGPQLAVDDYDVWGHLIPTQNAPADQAAEYVDTSGDDDAMEL